MKISVDQIICKGCGVCVDVCPFSAIELHAGRIAILEERCTLCQACIERCTLGALSLTEYDVEIERISPVPLPAKAPPLATSARDETPPTMRLGESLLTFVGNSLLPGLVDALVQSLDGRNTNLTCTRYAPTGHPLRLGAQRRCRQRQRGSRMQGTAGRRG